MDNNQIQTQSQIQTKRSTSTFYRWSKPLYIISVLLFYLLSILVYTGLFYVNRSYISHLYYFIHIFVCVFLIVRFHPLKEHRLTQFDSQIIFTSAVFLLINMGTMTFIENVLDKVGIHVDIPEVKEVIIGSN